MAYVAPVQTADGTHAVIKLNMPSEKGSGNFKDEIDTIARANGHGYVQVLKFDYKRRALLLEQLGLSMQDVKLGPEQAIKLLCGTLKQAWLVLPGENQKIDSSEYRAHTLAQLITNLWNKLERPCSEEIISQALEFAHRRMDAFDPAKCVFVHGDPHPANALQVMIPRAGAESGYVFVDPDGFLCEPEYDLGVVLRDWNEELLAAADPAALARKYCRLLAKESGLNENTIWEWSFIERVSTGLYISAYGTRELGKPFFDTAQRLLNS